LNFWTMTYWPVKLPNGVAVGAGVKEAVAVGAAVAVDMAVGMGVAVRIGVFEGSGVIPLVGGGIESMVGPGMGFTVHPTNNTVASVQSQNDFRIPFFHLSNAIFPLMIIQNSQKTKH